MVRVEWEWQSRRDRVLGFRYLWMKTVTGFLPRHHCARCLKGEYHPEFGPTMDVNARLGAVEYSEGTLLYICGVSSPYRWPQNLHLAGRVTAGAQAGTTVWTGDQLTVSGLERIPFDDRAARRRFPERGEDYLTCRNFQFGAQLIEPVR